MNKQLQIFFDNTQQLHTLLFMALFLIVVFLFIPGNMKFVKFGGQLLVISILGYILYSNFIETRKFSQQYKLDTDSIETVTDFKNNVLASYILCGFILLLMLYIVYSLR